MGKPSQEAEKPKISPEYMEFLLAEIRARKPRGIYERLCKFAEKLNLRPPKQFAEKLNYDVAYSSLNVSPQGVYSASFLVLFILSFVCFLFTFLFFDFRLLFVSILLPLLAFWYLYSYPGRKSKEMKKKIEEESKEVLGRIATLLKSGISFERAMTIVAKESRGLISEDFNKIIWNLQQGTYRNVDEALNIYRQKWLWWNEKFVRVLDLLRDVSAEKNPKVREELFKKVVESF